MIDLDLHLPRPPFWLVALLLVGVVLSWVPLAMIAKSRVSLSRQTKIHLFQDMDHQPGPHKAQAASPLFRDGRAMRQPVAGTVAWGHEQTAPSADALRADDHYYRGYKLAQDAGSDEWSVRWYDSIPPQINVNKDLLQRGKQQYGVYCYPCHGEAGYGQGPIHQRALELAGAGGTQWIPPADLHQTNPDGELTFGPELYPDGKMYNTISNGIRNMPGYASQIEVEDRWAIVAYVRALQRSQNAPLDALPARQREKLR